MSARRVLGKLFLLGLSLFASSLLFFSLLEFFPPLIRQLNFYILPYFQFKESYISDNELIFRYKPHFKLVREFQGDLYSPAYGVSVPRQRYESSFDENGFRNPSGETIADVVALGDSFLEMGLNEADTFSERLSKRSGLKVSNLGLAWYGPYQYIHVLERYGIRQEPKYALFCFFEGNDISDIEEYLKWKKGGSYHNWDQFSKGFFQRYWIAVTQSINYLNGKIYERIHIENFRRNLVDLNLKGKTYKCVFNYRNDRRPGEELLKTSGWIHLQDILGNFKQICLRNHIAPVVVFIPTKEHIYAAYSSGNSGKKWLKVRNQELAAGQNREIAMIRLCEGLQITLINLAPLFDSLAKEGKFLYYPFDTHWNSEGREYSAAYVAEKLKLGKE